MNDNLVFIDTGAWFAAIAKNDQYHSRATKHWNKLKREKTSFVTTNLIAHETTMLLERKINRRSAIAFLDAVTYDLTVKIVHADEEIEHGGFRLYQKFHDRDFSITDCVSFVVMNCYEIKRCFTFDQHFAQMGFLNDSHL